MHSILPRSIQMMGLLKKDPQTSSTLDDGPPANPEVDLNMAEVNASRQNKVQQALTSRDFVSDVHAVSIMTRPLNSFIQQLSFRTTIYTTIVDETVSPEELSKLRQTPFS